MLCGDSRPDGAHASRRTSALLPGVCSIIQMLRLAEEVLEAAIGGRKAMRERFRLSAPSHSHQYVSSGVDSHKGLAQQQLGVLVGPGLRWQRLEEHDAALSAQIANVRRTTARRQRVDTAQ